MSTSIIEEGGTTPVIRFSVEQELKAIADNFEVYNSRLSELAGKGTCSGRDEGYFRSFIDGARKQLADLQYSGKAERDLLRAGRKEWYHKFLEMETTLNVLLKTKFKVGQKGAVAVVEALKGLPDPTPPAFIEPGSEEISVILTKSKRIREAAAARRQPPPELPAMEKRQGQAFTADEFKGAPEV